MRAKMLRRHDSKADQALADLIARVDWPDVARRLLLYVAERLAIDGASEGRYPKAKSYVEQAVSQFFDHRHEFTLVTEDKLFDCLCVVANCLMHDDAEAARRSAERATPGTEVSARASISARLWSSGGRKKS